MTLILLEGWREGMKKVSLSKIQHELLDMPLRVAKENVDRLLSGEDVTIEIENSNLAIKFKEAVDMLGVDCKIIT